MLEGRTAGQKRKITKRITDAWVEEAGSRREAIIVAFHEVSKESYASGGELMIDKEPRKYITSDFHLITPVIHPSRLRRAILRSKRGISHENLETGRFAFPVCICFGADIGYRAQRIHREKILRRSQS
jgi:4-oxalocrotonate tautomerase